MFNKKFNDLDYCYNKINGNKGLRSYLNELSWKRSELTGKYTGCQFWSVESFDLFKSEKSKLNYNCKKLERELSKKSNAKRIVHEHVFPRKDFVQLIIDKIDNLLQLSKDQSINCIMELMDKYCVGYVVTEDEHNYCKNSNYDNPWIRYQKANIKLIPNDSYDDPSQIWLIWHAEKIKQANLID